MGKKPVYAAEYVEGAFSEVRLDGVLRSFVVPCWLKHVFRLQT